MAHLKKKMRSFGIRRRFGFTLPYGTYLLDTCEMIPVDPYRIHGEWLDAWLVPFLQIS